MGPHVGLAISEKKNYSAEDGTDGTISLSAEEKNDRNSVPWNKIEANMGNPMPESALILCQSRLYPPVKEIGFAHRTPSRTPPPHPIAIK